MMDGIRTDRAAVDDQDLIKRLNISIPFSPTNSDIRHDQRLPLVSYKGIYLEGIPRGSEPGRYWFQLRGSLIKLANNGLHNDDFKDPYELLYALDDLVTSLRINPFKTPLNGLELSATIPVNDPKQVCSSIVSYLNHPPNRSIIDRDGLRLPYVEVEGGQHRLKLYAPREGALRVEVNVNKMQYLGNNRPQTFSDLVDPRYAAVLAEKLLTVFGKIIWKIPNPNIKSLTLIERELYLNGRVHEHWQVRQQDYNNYSEFKRTEKQRSREKEAYNDLVQRYWLHEPPTEIKQQLQQRLNNNIDLMQASLYQTLLDICLNRWQYVGNLPGIIRLPNHLKLPPLSEIYPLYLSRFPTRHKNTHAYRTVKLAGAKNPPLNLFNPSEGVIGSSLEHSCSHNQKGSVADSSNSLQPNRERKPFANELVRLKKMINKTRGQNGSLTEVTSMLSARTRIALAYTGQSVNELLYSNRLKLYQSRPTPLFPD